MLAVKFLHFFLQGAGPLGLKLDKVGVTKMLRGMGMNRLAEF